MNKICGICNKNECSKTQKFSANFTNYDHTQNKNICDACHSMFTEELRKNSWIINKSKAITLLKQKDILGQLNNLTFPCIISFSESKKKHRRYRSRTSYGYDEIFITLDDGFITINKHDIDLANILELYLNQYKLTKTELLTGQFSIKKLEIIGLQIYQHIQKIRALYGEEKLNFFISIINYEDRN